jgi:hypothetical protein
MRIVVRAGAVSEEEQAEVSGGGAPAVKLERQIPVGDAAPGFGVERFEQVPEEEGGGVDAQAGSHPFQFTTTLALDQTADPIAPPALVKNLRFNLPTGLVGNATLLPQCSELAFREISTYQNHCPADTVVGVATITFDEPKLGLRTWPLPLFNLVPARGEPARFGFTVVKTPVTIDTSVRTGRDNGVTASASNIPEVINFLSESVTFWGVPGAAVHDESRGWGCLVGGGFSNEGCAASSEESPGPFLTMPTACGPYAASVEGESWPFRASPGAEAKSIQLPRARYSLTDGFGRELGITGCNQLSFDPSIEVAPDVQEASKPSGLSVHVRVPQEVSENPGGLASSSVKTITVALPEGMSINPSGGGGLEACSEGQVGFEASRGAGGFEEFESGVKTALFSSGLPEPLSPGLNLGALGFCTNASKIGTVKITTPLIPNPVVGSVYLASQDANPFGSLIAMYLIAEDPVSGVLVKLAGRVHLDEKTGQVVTTFENGPEVPFEDAELHFFGGERAPLSTPPLCGSYTTTSSIAPWSGNPAAEPSSTFQVTSGPNASACQSPRPFQPGFEAGTTSVQAGGYTPLTITMTRPDADQPLGKLSVVFPPGISAGLRGVKLCEEPQAATGDCPAESQIGQVIASAGLGADPYSVETGKAYITGPYGGAPFGVDVVVPAVAGPFNLGTEVVRSKVDVDPTDARLTVVSDAFPTMLDGIPLELQHINVTVNRPGFVFNPTSCEPMKLTGELESSEGATADVSTPFQVTNCAALSFKPVFAVSTSAKTSRIDGASLHATLTLPNTPRGTGANVAKVKVSLPKQLPSPLKTLQKACTEKVFAENPTNCPVASRVGEATVNTPVLEGPLSGPAYFVSHGGAKYPELIIVLTGEDGVTVQVHGETQISKQGITTATFNTVPDVPFSGFELTLPEREYPALSANGNLCTGTLIMPTEITGQNGIVIKQETKISVTGCPKTKQATHKKKRKKHKTHGKQHKTHRKKKG